MYYKLNITSSSLLAPTLFHNYYVNSKHVRNGSQTKVCFEESCFFFQSEDMTSMQIKYARYLKHELNENTQHAIHTKSVKSLHSHQHS